MLLVKTTLLVSLIHVISGDYVLTVLHTNDVHARIEEFNKYIGHCEANLAEECFGGAARLHTAVNKIRKEEKNVILLDGGDQFQGTLWYNTYKWKASVAFMNYTRYDAMGIGNHEFDDGPSGLIPFIEKANFSVLACNMNAQKERKWPKSKKFNMKSVILERSGIKIGVIGYITVDTTWMSKPGSNIKFLDVVESVREEAKSLKSKGVNILIALGHAGIQVDIKIARLVSDIDIVVGGHTNTFLYTGKRPSNERPSGVYPLHVSHSDDSKTLVVQDYAFGKYLGYLKVKFDEKGDVTSWEGNPLLLNSSYSKDPGAMKMVHDMADPILEMRKKPVGRSLVHLNISRTRESNLGNLVTDALVKMTQQFPDETRWASVSLAFWNSGGIRKPILKNITETISLAEISEILPFGNTADLMEVNGTTLKAVFEQSGSMLPQISGRFLQVSGFRVTYAKENPVGSRVVDLRALCTSCRVPAYIPVKNDDIYKVVTCGYLMSGGDGYSMLKSVPRHSGNTALSILQNYITKESPITTALEGRISFLEEKTCNASMLLLNNTAILYLAWIFFYLVAP